VMLLTSSERLYEETLGMRRFEAAEGMVVMGKRGKGAVPPVGEH